LSRIVRDPRTVHVADARQMEAYIKGDPFVASCVNLGDARTFMLVPMLKERTLIGAIGIFRQDVLPFTDKQIELVQNFAAQAVIAIENARLLSELRESLAQQTATSEVLEVISSSPGDLQPVFDAMLENATRLCEAKFGFLHLNEEAGLRRAAAHNVPHIAELPLGARHFHSLSAIGRAAATKMPVQISNYAENEVYKSGDVSAVFLVERAGARTLLCIPMLKDDELVGMISIYRQEVRPFTDKQVELVKNFAAQAVIAIENARLLTELRESLEQQTATSKVLEVISSSPGELEPVFAAMLENAVRICDAKFGNIYRWDGELLHLAAAYNTPPALAAHRKNVPMRIEQNQLVAPMVATKLPNQILDAATIEGYLERRDPAAVSAVELGGVRTSIAVPMLKDEELVGSLSLYRQEVRPFTEKQVALVASFANQAVIAIENARLLSELRESLAQQTATSEVLRVISSSPGQLAPVFGSILENAAGICEAKFATLYLAEGDKFRVAAMHNAPPGFIELQESRGTFAAKPGTLLDRVLRNRQVAQSDDLAAEALPGAMHVEIGGARSTVCVPMLKDDALIGAIFIYRQEVRPFTDKQIALLQNFAAQAVIAIENARLLSELRSRTDELGRSVGELRALGEVSQAVNSTLDLENVLETIVAKAVQLSSTDAGAIYVFDDAQRDFHLRATYGMDQGLIAALSDARLTASDRNIAALLAEREPVQSADLGQGEITDIDRIILRAGYRSRLTAPLIRGEDIVGMLVVRRRAPGSFAQNTVDLIKTFAAQSAVAIQNARLYANVETRTRELGASLADLRTAQDRLIQTEKLASLGQLTAGIAHEIKNPLNFVNNFSSLSTELIDELQQIIDDIDVDDKKRNEVVELTGMLRGNLEKVVQHGKRADSIVKNMLLHSRQGSGEHQLVDVNALVEESLNLAYHGARAEKQGFNITLERAFDPSAGKADLFPQEITRVLLNLISNGFYAATKRKAAGNGGNYEPTLSAATKNLGDSVEIRIRDNGTGIPPEVKDKMFNPFFTTKPAGEGTGLGLSLSYDIIVKQHSGSIEVDTAPGEFTEFRIVLPRGGAGAEKTGGNA